MTIDVSAAPAVTGPRNLTPGRRPRSVRRTASLTTTWGPDVAEPMEIHGECRDLLTPGDDMPAEVVGTGSLRAHVTRERVIERISADPAHGRLSALVGARAGGRLRELLREVMPDERSAGTPLYLLLDDLSGASLVSGFALALWPQRWPADWQDAGGNRAARRSLEGVCIGFQSGSSALSRPLGAPDSLNTRNVGPLPDQDDSLSWHAMDYELVDVSMRRARRIDVWLDGDRVEVDAAFQDSATHPDGGRVAVHQYRLWATAELATGRIEAVHAEPHVLPFGECPLAVLNIPQLVGTPLQDMRDTVLERLKGVHGCTHLNDALRSLAEAPILARFLAKL